MLICHNLSKFKQLTQTQQRNIILTSWPSLQARMQGGGGSNTPPPPFEALFWLRVYFPPVLFFFEFCCCLLTGQRGQSCTRIPHPVGNFPKKEKKKRTGAASRPAPNCKTPPLKTSCVRHCQPSKGYIWNGNCFIQTSNVIFSSKSATQFIQSCSFMKISHSCVFHSFGGACSLLETRIQFADPCLAKFQAGLAFPSNVS